MFGLRRKDKNIYVCIRFIYMEIIIKEFMVDDVFLEESLIYKCECKILEVVVVLNDD